MWDLIASGRRWLALARAFSPAARTVLGGGSLLLGGVMTVSIDDGAEGLSDERPALFEDPAGAWFAPRGSGVTGAFLTP